MASEVWDPPPPKPASKAEKAREAFFGVLERRHFYDGEVIFREDRPGHEAYIIDTGEVEIFTGPEDNPTVLNRAGPRSIFGEMALVTRQPRSASARATRNTICFVINADDFRERLGEVSPFMQVIVKVLAENVRGSNSTIDAAAKQIRRQKKALKEAQSPGSAAPKPRPRKEVTDDDEPPGGPKAVSRKGVAKGA